MTDSNRRKRRAGQNLRASDSATPAPVWSLVVGDSLPPIEQFLAGPAQAIAFCPKCQAKLPPGARFCGSCGARLA